MTTRHPTLDLHPSPPNDSRSKFVRWRTAVWPWVPALLLTSLIGMQLAVLSSTLDDPTFATEADYYRKATDWDAQQARARQSQALGWTARARVEASAGAGHALSVSLEDARHAAIDGAEVRAIAFHNARAGQPRELILPELSPGVYRAELGAARAGVWELRLSAKRDPDRYETTLRFEIDPAGGSP